MALFRRNAVSYPRGVDEVVSPSRFGWLLKAPKKQQSFPSQNLPHYHRWPSMLLLQAIGHLHIAKAPRRFGRISKCQGSRYCNCKVQADWKCFSRIERGIINPALSRCGCLTSILTVKRIRLLIFFSRSTCRHPILSFFL